MVFYEFFEVDVEFFVGWVVVVVVEVNFEVGEYFVGVLVMFIVVVLEGFLDDCFEVGIDFGVESIKVGNG